MTLPADYSPDAEYLPDEPDDDRQCWAPGDADPPDHVETLCERCGEYDECWAVLGRMLCLSCCSELGVLR